jgi:hypothetical protein
MISSYSSDIISDNMISSYSSDIISDNMISSYSSDIISDIVYVLYDIMHCLVTLQKFGKLSYMSSIISYKIYDTIFQL